MARRRRRGIGRAIAAGLAGAAEGYGRGKLIESQEKRAIQAQNATLDRQLLTKLEDIDQKLEDAVTKGEMSPTQAAQRAYGARQRAGFRLPLPDFSGFGASADTRLVPVLGDIEKATSPEMLPTEEGLVAKLKALGIGERPAPVVTSEAEDLPPVMEPTPQLATAQGVRRRRIEGFEEGRKRGIATAIEQAGGTAGATAQAQEDVLQKNFGNILGRTLTTEAGKGNIGVQNALRTEQLVGPVRERNQAWGAGAAETARLQAYFSPQFSNARLREATEKAMAELDLAGEKERRGELAKATTAAAMVRPQIDALAEVTSRINTREGLSARGQGTKRQLMGALGMDPEIGKFNQQISQIIRPLAVAMGVREANVAIFEAKMVQQGIGLSAGATATERNNALRNLYDLIDIGPLVAARPLSEDAGQRAEYASNLLKERRAAEDAAIAAGQTFYNDPVLDSVRPVVPVQRQQRRR